MLSAYAINEKKDGSGVYGSVAIKPKSWISALYRFPKPAVVGTLLIIFAISYLLALQGGDLVFINEHLGIIGAELFVSVVCLTTVTVMLYASRMRNSTRRIALLAIFCLFTALYLYDHGERFEKHGFYNLLVFLVIFIPANLGIAIFYILWCKIAKFMYYFCTLVVVGGFLACISLVHYRHVFDQGTLGKLQNIQKECQWVGPNIPYVDLLPAGAQNFWAGSMYCKPEPLKIKAHIDRHGILRVKCSQKTEDIFVDILPETRQWPLKDKDMWNVYNHRVLDKIERVQYDWQNPLRLNETTQAVVVRCGSTGSTIVTRVSPIPDKLPTYVPPKDSDTRQSTMSLNHDNTSYRRRPNVIFIMLDAVSHRQFYRRLPKTAHELRNLHNPGAHRLYELYRYHSVGFSTDNNTKAMYTGEIVPSNPNPLPIWAYFRDRGYITARIETGCDDWAKELVGNYYNSQDYSVGNRSLDYELTAPFCMPEYYPQVGNAFGNFKGPYSILARCLYGRYVHEWAFDYLSQLREALKTKNRQGRPYMITATFMEGHEGTGEVLRTMDDALSTFVREISQSGELDDTVFIIGADHGLHMGLNFAFLQNGRIEHQNPFWAMSVPEWLYQFAEDYQHKSGDEKVSPFAANEQRLTTPFETHHTFRVMAEWPNFNDDSWRKSLFFAQKAGRTCDEAGIGANFCMCKKK